MLVDDNVFVGSLNISNPYSGVKYGSLDFRDLNVYLKKHPAKECRAFFKNIMLRNQYHMPGELATKKLNEIFKELDLKEEQKMDFYKKEAEKLP